MDTERNQWIKKRFKLISSLLIFDDKPGLLFNNGDQNALKQYAMERSQGTISHILLYSQTHSIEDNGIHFYGQTERIFSDIDWKKSKAYQIKMNGTH